MPLYSRHSKSYWVPLPKDLLGASSQRPNGCLFPKIYWVNGSPSASSKENDDGHFQDADTSASESERSAELEENIVNFEGDDLQDHPQKGINQVNEDVQNLKRSFGPSVFPRNFNDFVVDSKVDAMNAEMDVLYRNNNWELVDLPIGRKAIGSKLVCLINLAVQSGWTLYQMDVNNAFLYGDLNEFVYMTLSPGYFPTNETKVCKLNNSLYRLKPAHRKWNAKLTSALIECGFVQSKSDYSLFTKSFDDVFIALFVYVDDIIVTGNNLPEINKFKQFLKTKFMIKDLGNLKYFLGIEVLETPNGICLSQRNEPKDDDPLLKNVIDYQKLIGKLIYLTTTRPDIAYTVSCLSINLVKQSASGTPLETNKALIKDEEAEDVDVHLYRSMIGSLMYLTASRPDIMFAVCACTRFQVTPKTSHLHAAKRIFRYLKGQPKLGLWYPKDSPFHLEAFLDSDYAGASLDRKSTT
ncbi:ribonuclease H-like domain-containing protein [Tanacetum coccineum]